LGKRPVLRVVKGDVNRKVLIPNLIAKGNIPRIIFLDCFLTSFLSKGFNHRLDTVAVGVMLKNALARLHGDLFGAVWVILEGSINQWHLIPIPIHDELFVWIELEFKIRDPFREHQVLAGCYFKYPEVQSVQILGPSR
jgi:hypothetical protein